MSLSYLPGTASLLEELDKRLLVVLRDGRTLIGYLRSVDQFANLVLHRCIERIHVGREYGDIPRGVFVVRGENVVRPKRKGGLNYLVVLLGEIDAEQEAQSPLKEVSLEEILEAQSRQQADKDEKERIRAKVFKERGLAYTGEVTCDDNY
eukprot:TCALIF_08214-PA protein Name:"Similar to Lsm1 U6 snRNA-associated Sm-like protein LSm1 (Mus musculus)" AED:0.45 eAED:0.45 QI:0/0/0.5/1/1/1/2/69/149